MKKLWPVVLCLLPPVLHAAGSCEDLAKLVLPHTAITLAQIPPAGEYKDVPRFCRVAATLMPVADSEIKIEVWLPLADWNGRLLSVGNGGWNGAIGYGPLSAAVRRGFAAAATDTGHSGSSGSFALGHPEKIVDFGYRAVHEMTVAAKATIREFYGSGPRYSYWSGCSTGGRQGLSEAQRYPADYDGIVAGAPANYLSHLHVWSIAVAQAVNQTPESFIPKEKYPALHKAVLEACDALDGLKDGVLEDPTRCTFEPKTIECQGEDSPACLTAPQVEAARKIYAPVKNSRTGEEIFPGMEPGSELGWASLAGRQAASVATDSFTYVIYKNPQWDWRTMNLDSDVALADKAEDGVLNATDPNLGPFLKRKGKLLIYHGWSDQLIAPGNSVNYYHSVAKAMGGASATEDSVRLFMVPGMAHCGGGEGPNEFDMVGAVQRWVEQGTAPDEILAFHRQDGAVVRTRLLCPYPRVGRYKGTGSPDEAANFSCAQP